MIEAVFIGVLAWVFVMILTKEGMIFGWWDKVLRVLPEWLSEPLGGCEYCLAGQMALWYYLYRYWDEYDFFNHIFFIGMAIFVVELINIWKQRD